MITEKQTKDYVDWIKKAVTENNFEYYDYSEFTNVNEINNNFVGNIFRANWRGTDNILIKTSYNVEEIVNELKIRREVDFHQNILRFYGISKLDTGLVNQMNEYLLVLEYADGGSLHSYLKKNFNNLEWNDKYQLALQLANAIECIHNKGIIHFDLHASNVLVHQDRIKLADFGLSKKKSETSNYPEGVFGLLPYVDPKYLNYICNTKDGDQTYEINVKSDVYSIGVLFWQLSSGHRPFCADNDDVQYNANLAIVIENGKREDIIKGTPVEYSNLYTACWSGDPNKRPTIQQIISSLESIISSQENHSIIHVENERLPEPISFSMDEDIIMGQDNDLDAEENEENKIPLYILKQAEKLFKELFDLTNTNIIIDKLIMLLIRVHDEKGYNYMETNQFINRCISLLNQPQSNILDCLLRNQTTSRYIFFLGFLYYNGIIVDANSNEAFKLFSKASEDNYHIAQVYLSECYQSGMGTEINSELSITYLYNAIENNSIYGQVILGNLYEDGVVVDRDLNQAFYWYEEAANNGNLSGLYHLGICYQYENGVEKDENKAFVFYMKAANQENLNAQYKLGVCYYYGIGTNINKAKAVDLFKIVAKEENYSNAQTFLGVLYEKGEGIEKDIEKAFYWYQKAAESGNEIAQYNLGLCYEDGKGVEKDKIKAFEWYKKSAEQGNGNAQNSLGFYYNHGIGTEKDLEKAFYWYKKAAENGNSIAQYNLGECFEFGIGGNKDYNKAFEWYKKSAENGDIDAKFQLGYCYVNGIGVEINKEKGFELYNEAAGKNDNDMQINIELQFENDEKVANDLDKVNYWYQKAAENDNKVALYKLGELYELGEGVSEIKTKAFEFYKKSAEQGFINAQYKVGYYYDHGIEVDVNKEKAFNLYEIAAKGENCDAQKSLALLYEKGEGTKKSIEKAIYWYKKAVENGCQEAKESLSNLLLNNGN